MNELVNIQDTMSSLQIAELTDKQHAHVMRDIRSLLEQGVAQSNFGLSNYKDVTGRTLPCYQLTKKGCLILASGYDAKLREKIIDRWEELECEKVQITHLIPKTFSEALMLAAHQQQQIEAQQQQIEQKNVTIGKLQPKADFADAAFQAEGKVDIGQASKILGLPFGRNTIFKKLKQAGVFFSNRNEPKQRFIDAGYFELSQLPPIHRENHPDLIVMKVTCTQKGLAYINRLFGGSPSSNKLTKIVPSL